jgi:hypothetical protein
MPPVPRLTHAPTCTQGAARNKMLVKGASSYNALKRAIKQVRCDARVLCACVCVRQWCRQLVTR